MSDHQHHDHDQAPVTDVDVHAARALVDDGALLLDVREQHEWDAGHAPTAVHVPLGDLPRVDTASLPAVRVVAICRSGNRSGVAAQYLGAAGVDVVNVAGGMVAWSEAGLPVVTSGPHDDDAPSVG